MSKETYDKSQEYSRAKVPLCLEKQADFAGEIWVSFESMESSYQFDFHLLQRLALSLGTHENVAICLLWLQFSWRGIVFSA